MTNYFRYEIPITKVLNRYPECSDIYYDPNKYCKAKNPYYCHLYQSGFGRKPYFSNFMFTPAGQKAIQARRERERRRLKSYEELVRREPYPWGEPYRYRWYDPRHYREKRKPKRPYFKPRLPSTRLYYGKSKRKQRRSQAKRRSTPKRTKRRQSQVKRRKHQRSQAKRRKYQRSIKFI